MSNRTAEGERSGQTPLQLRCMIMRGGTSKGAYLLAADMPADPAARDDLVVRIVGSPDPRQIDGMGGAHPLTTKVAVVGPSSREDADVDYLFLQPSVAKATVSNRQNCGNLLAGVGPFAVERGLAPATDGTTTVRIHMVNTASVATARFEVRGGFPVYTGATSISGVPGSAAPISLEFEDIAGGSCGSMLPTGNAVDVVAGVECTLIDNGMPVVVVRASDLGISGYEDCEDLDANSSLRTALDQIRLVAGPLMNLGDVSNTTVPKVTMVAPPRAGGALCTRTFIPHRCHSSIGVLGAVSVATAARLADSPAASVSNLAETDTVISIEHPTGTFEANVTVVFANDGSPIVRNAGIVRTARKLMDGIVFPRPRT